MASKEDDKSKEGKAEGGDGKDGEGKEDKKGLDKLTSGLAAGLNVVKPQEKRPKLVKGSYTVHVHIIEARDLKGAGSGDMSDPVARVEVMGKNQHTKIMKKALNCMWDEVLVFEFKDLEPEEVERGKCVIRILDANTFRSDVLIGLFEFDLAQIYFSPHHELYRQWCALTDTTDKREGIQGFLKFSLIVLGPNDEQFIHSAADADDDDGGMMGVLMPPEVEQRGKLLRVQCLYVAELPMMDEKIFGMGGGCDPYVRVEFAGIDVRTDHKKGQTAEILQELLVPVMEPTMTTSIKLTVWDWDQAGSNDLISTLTFDYADIKDHPEKYSKHKWYQLYGAPEPNTKAQMLSLAKLKSGNPGEKMDKGFLPGSYYRGRVMLNFTVEDSKEPKKDTITCNGLMESQRPEEIQWKVEFDLYEGSEIPEKGSHIPLGKPTGKARIELCVGRQSVMSEKQEVKEGQCQWYQPLKDVVIQMPKDPEQCPDIYVYLVIHEKRVSFIRFPFADMVKRGWDVPPAWYILAEDPVLDALTDQEFPGSVLFSMRVGPFSSAPPEPTPKSRPLKYDIPASELGMGEYGVDDPSPSPLGSPSPMRDEKDGKETKGEPDLMRSPTYDKRYEEGKVSKVGTLTLELVEATNLPAMDRGGTSDPFVKFEMGDFKFQSAVKKKTLNPKWNQTFTFKDVSVDTPLKFTCYDEDVLSNDVMGDYVVDVKSMQLASKVPMGKDFSHDAWFFLSNTKATNAQVRLKFNFKYVSVAESAALQADIEKRIAKKEKSFLGLKIPGTKKKQTGFPGADALGIPERRAYQLRCHIFQARSLPPLDSNGLADPYVVIRCAGKKLKLDRKEKTLNPQWYITKDINLTLPIPLHFAPKIQCFVYDWDQLGSDEPLGRFAITCLEASTMNPSLEEIKPKWFSLTDFEGKPSLDDAKVLASFQLVTADDAARAGSKITDIRPPTTPMFIEIVTLGLRSLQSTLGVHKTFINFELPNGKRFATRQSNRPSAKSPNFLQVLKLPCDLPTKAIFAPALLIEVRDVLFGGLIKRLIGTAALDMSQFMTADEKGDWKPAERVKLISDEDVERAIKDEELKKKEVELKAKMDEEKRKLDDEEAKEREAKILIEEEEGPSGDKKVKKKDDLKEPLLQDPSSSGDVKVEVKDDGAGVGELKDKGADTSPLLGGDESNDPKAVKKEFETADKIFDTLDLASAGSIPDEPEEIPKYMKGRVTVDDELEDTMPMKPFHTITVSTGQKNAGKFSMNKFRKVGNFKGLVRLYDEKNPGTEMDTKELLNPVELYCRVYILRGLGLMPKDSNGKSDPYLILKLGKTKISTRDRYIKDTLEPNFYESFEIPCTIPGDAKLEITCMDWDGIGDDLIGITEVDIEDRWFTKEWRAMALKPLERRTLRTSSSTKSQGKLEMWVELLKPEQAKREPMLHIKPPPPDPFELRLIIWGVRDCPIKDELTKQNDLYVTCSCSVPGLKKQETDTHWRSKKGKGNFNWRMKFPVSLPILPWPRLRFQIWDRDIFSPNDSIAELVISVKALCKMAQKKKNRVKAILKGKDRFYLEGLRHPNFKGSQGKMEISLEILPIAMASQLPAGLGRSDPNANCFLPEPEGRVNWSLLHPFDMLKEILGPELYRKICLGCCCMLFTAACVFMAPMIVSNLITNVLT